MTMGTLKTMIFELLILVSMGASAVTMIVSKAEPYIEKIQTLETRCATTATDVYNDISGENVDCLYIQH